MKKSILSLLTGAALLGSVGVASAAEPMVLTDAEMDGITAGAIIRLNRIKADNLQERGHDELYFTFYDNNTGSTKRTNIINIRQGQQVNLGRPGTDEFSFGRSVDLRLWEQDPANPDDLIDSVTIYATRLGTRDEPFTRPGVRHVLNYTVRR